MVYFLDNGDAFLLYVQPSVVIYAHFCATLNAPTKRDLRWVIKDIYNRQHFEGIEKLLQAKSQGDKNIGKVMLEQSLKIVINGEIVGHDEG